jgi:glucose-1-phosphate thymidylyltransferase
MKVLIAVAGYGTRLYPLTENQPKALLPIKGKPIIDYLIDGLEHIKEVDSIYLISNNKFYTNFAWWLSNKKTSKKIEIFDTGSLTVEDQQGALNDCLMAINQHEIDDDLLILYGDNMFSLDLKRFIDFFNKKQTSCLACYELKNKEDAKKFGIVEINQDNKIVSIEEKPQESKSNLAVTGIYIIKKQDLDKIKEFYEKSKEEGKLTPSYSITFFIIDLFKNQDVYAFPFSGEWIDIGSMDDYERVK